MRCPKCSLIVSNKKDICPQCLQDLRPTKKELGLPLSQPDASYEQLRGESLSAKSSTSPELAAPQTTQPAQQKTSWIKRLMGKEPVKQAAPEPPAPEIKIETKAPAQKPAPQPAKTVEQKAEPAPEPKKKSLDEALSNLSFEEDPLNLETDNGLDRIEPMIAADDSLFHLPDIDSVPIRPAPPAPAAPPRTAPAAGGGLALASEDLAEDDLDKLFTKINEACLAVDSDDEEDDDDLFVLAPNEGTNEAPVQKAGHPAPAILDFQDDESLMNEKLDELLGGDVIDVKAVKAAPRAPMPQADDEDLEISFEVDLDDEDLEDDEDELEAKLAAEEYDEAGAGVEAEAADDAAESADEDEDLLDTLITIVSKLLDIPEEDARDAEKLVALASRVQPLTTAQKAQTAQIAAANQGVEADDLWVDYLIDGNALEAMQTWHAAEEAARESSADESWQAAPALPEEAYYDAASECAETGAEAAPEEFTADEAPACELILSPARKESEKAEPAFEAFADAHLAQDIEAADSKQPEELPGAPSPEFVAEIWEDLLEVEEDEQILEEEEDSAPDSAEQTADETPAAGSSGSEANINRLPLTPDTVQIHTVEKMEPAEAETAAAPAEPAFVQDKIAESPAPVEPAEPAHLAPAESASPCVDEVTAAPRSDSAPQAAEPRIARVLVRDDDDEVKPIAEALKPAEPAKPAMGGISSDLLARMLAEEEAALTAEPVPAQEKPEVTEGLWDSARDEVSAVQASTEREISALEVFKFEPNVTADILFVMAADELVDPERYTRSAEPAGSEERRLKAEALTEELKVIKEEIEQQIDEQQEPQALSMVFLPDPAPRWRRAASFFVDLTLTAGFALGATAGFASDAMLHRLAAASGAISLDDLLVNFLPLSLIAAAAWILVNSVLIGLRGQTVGQRLMGISVVDADGEPIGFARALLRTLSQFTTVLTGGAGALLILGQERSALHDRMSGTSVVMP